MKKRTKILFVAILGLIGLTVFGINKVKARYAGTEILLKSRPMNSKDLFRGDYVILSYDISWFEAGKIQASRVRNFKPNETVYVTLNKADRYVRIKQIHYDPPPGELYIKGKVDSVCGNMVHVVYGIETHFVSELEGRRMAHSLPQESWNVVAAVDDGGKAMIKQLVRLDEQEVDFE